MLNVQNVTKEFGKRGKKLVAVKDVTLTLLENEIFALIGESGSGKSTLAEIIVGLERPTQGEVIWQGEGDFLSHQAARIQMVFQNPDRSLNPYWKVKDLIAEPLVLKHYSRSAVSTRVEEMLEKVLLPKDLLERRASECSGGQKQRIAIARALTLSPTLLIADEITSALDPKTEQEILDLLLSLKREQKMSILYITHRLETISGFADRVAVMKEGSIVEEGYTDALLKNPNSDYTKALLEACSYS
ncbi:ABC transporter ATP-binding protein [Paenibacillus sp. IHBB 10380]|uniref:ABC transporter ATP-binding protein n=1 Tax=Paenibacillus sp. IHBB 10380 TaxID=1566358 RepID=UPI0005CFBECB|nr:ABC transporter ATP-binding protein [Paenibacillus sp. IHBB 10380]AJS59048.1 ATPase [Paenibacillus sp. IHBB 10380]